VTRPAFGMLGLIALGAAIVVGTFAAFTKSEPGTFSSPVISLDAMPNEVRPSALTADAFDIGETVTAGDVSWTVTDANKVHEVSKYTFPPASEPGEFVTLDFEVENVSEEPVTLAEEEITLVDDEGRVYRAEPDINDAFIEHDKNVLFGEASHLKPSQKKEGKANFQVLPEASGFRAHLGDTDPTTSEGEYVDLRF
jgi:Domain of unknown function (DUF4352)